MNRKTVTGIILTLLLTGILTLEFDIQSVNAQPKTIYVDANNAGDPYEDGSEEHPFDMIQEGIDAADSGDTVLVEEGTYIENIIFREKNAITVKSRWGPTSTIIDGNRTECVVTFDFTSNNMLDGFTIRNGSGTHGAGVRFLGSPSATLTNCIITGNSADIGAAINCNGASPRIEKNIIQNNTAGGSGFLITAGIAIINVASPIIENNIIVNNHRGGGITMSLPEGTAPMIVNNVITNNSGGGIRLNYWGNVSIKNNIITSNTDGAGILCEFGTIPSVSFNNVWDNKGGNYGGIIADLTGINGNICEDPIFTDIISGNYHLQTDSPCIDAGTNEGAPNTDFDGNPRPIDGDGDGIAVVDMGAFEFVPETRTWTVDDDVPADFHTIQEAINAANPGDTIYVYNGTYHEHVTVYKSLTLIGENRSTTIVDGGGTGTVVKITTNNVNIGEFTMQNSGEHYPDWVGILLGFSNRSTISNNILLNNHFGILLSGSSENSIIGNAILNSYVGIFLEYTHLNESTDNIIVGNTISNNEYGLGIEECSGNTIYHNNFINNTMQAGVSLPHVNMWDNGYPSGGNYWSDHVCTGNPSDGSQPYIINANNIDHYPFQYPHGWLKVHNIDTGLNYTTIQEAIDAPETLDGHTIFVDAGIYCEYVVVNKLIRLIGESQVVTVIDGWVDVKANNVVIKGFAIGGFTAFSIGKTMYFGISLFGVADCIVSNNTVFNTGKGIWLWNSTDNVISDNHMMINGQGVYVDKSPNNTIIRNMIKGVEGVRISEYGIVLYSSPNTKIIENTISTNYKEGILVEFSSNTEVIQNIISTSREGIRISHSSNNFISQNNITLNRDYGIRAIQSHNNTIIQNTITNTSEFFMSNPGISFSDSYFNRIIQNNITNNYIGVAVASSALNIVSGNNISSNNYGIRLDYPWTNYNEVSDNIVSNNDYGIFLASSANNNTIFGNNIINNNRGIYLSGTNNNMFFHNNLIGNIQQVVSYDSTNLWDDGYPSGGNYWSDYTGVDVCSGVDQDEPRSDGIGDVPYFIDESNQDNYPLMKPWGPIKTVFNVIWGGETYPVTVVSNSTITDFNFNQPLKQISFNVTGPNGSTGFCNITIPKELLDGDFTVLIDGQPPLILILTQNETHTNLYFTYTHTIHQVKIIGTTVIGEEEKTLLGTGWGWMRAAHKEYVSGPAKLYKIGDEQIELVIKKYSRTWNIIRHKEYKNHEIYYCFSQKHGVLIVGLHHSRWTFWWAVGKDTVAFGHPRFGRLRLMPTPV